MTEERDKEDEDMEYYIKQRDRIDFTEIMKFSALMYGVYSVTQDVLNWWGVIGAGITYLFATVGQEESRGRLEEFREQRLESRLKENDRLINNTKGLERK